MAILTNERQTASLWPQKGDTLFASGPHWESEALLYVSWDSFLTYALGYKLAGDSVVASVEIRSIPADLAVYPACFLYRHYVESMLKALIKVGNQLLDGMADYPKDHHKIRKLWDICRPLLEEFCPEGDPAGTAAVEKCILEFDAMDPSGEVFRFAEYKDGSPSFKGRIQFSLTNMRDVMNRLSGFLEGSYDYMSELLQYQADIDSQLI